MIYILPIACLIPLAISAYLIFRSIAHPAIVIISSWSLVFLILLFSGSVYYTPDIFPITIMTMGIGLFAASSIAFSLYSHPIIGMAPKGKISSVVLIGCLSINILLLPFYLRGQLGNLAGSGSILFQIRRESLENVQGDLLQNVVLFANVCSILSIINCVRFKSKSNTVIFILSLACAGVYALFTGSKLPIISLIFSHGLSVMLMQPKKQFLTLFSMLISAIVFFVFSLYMINFAGLSSYGTSQRVFALFMDYIVGGVVAFAKNYDSILLFDNNQNLLSAFSSVLLAIGFDVQLKSIHYPYVEISGEKVTNVFTIFFPFIKEFGVLGAMLALVLIGAATSLVFRWSLNSVWLLAAYSIIGSSIILSIFGDPFLYGAYTIVKYVILIIVVFVLDRMIQSKNVPEAV